MKRSPKYLLMRWIWVNANNLARWAGRQMIADAIAEDKRRNP